MDTLERFQQECTVFFDSLSEQGRAPLVFGDGLSHRPVLPKRPPGILPKLLHRPALHPV